MCALDCSFLIWIVETWLTLVLFWSQVFKTNLETLIIGHRYCGAQFLQTFLDFVFVFQIESNSILGNIELIWRADFINRFDQLFLNLLIKHLNHNNKLFQPVNLPNTGLRWLITPTLYLCQNKLYFSNKVAKHPLSHMFYSNHCFSLPIHLHYHLERRYWTVIKIYKEKRHVWE